MARVRLRDIVSSGDRAAVMGLRRGPGQDQYLNSMEEIFAEAGEEQRAMPHPWAVHDAETGALVGFAMISDNIANSCEPRRRRSTSVPSSGTVVKTFSATTRRVNSCSAT